MEAAPVKVNGRTYYPHLEGMRGVAALYVFIFHIWQIAVQHAATATLGAWFAVTQFLQYGHFAVAIFIVISGYCLGLPVAQRAGLRFSITTFFQRRARRLMPAYVAVVFLSIVPFCITALLIGHRINPQHVVLAVGLHLALIHNLSFLTTEYLNGPLWSIALEVQIYVVFALILIPVWRTFGLIAMLAVAIAAGLVPHFVLHSFDWTAPWLCGLFGMGVVAAALTARADTLPKLPWKLLTLLATIVAIVTLIPFVDSITPDANLIVPDLAVGAAVALFFVAAVHDPRMLPVRFVASRPIVFLGAFSYSLYLIHAPLVDVLGAFLHRVHASVAVSAAAWTALIALVLVLAYAFYRVFERPFLSSPFREARDIETHAAAEPSALRPVIVRDEFARG